MHTVVPPSDIVVVGAGIVGCAVAYELACRGASVRVVDDRPAGMGATQASAGILAPFNEAPDGGPLLELTTRSLDLYDTFIARVSADTGLPLNYQRTGTLDVALQPQGAVRLADIHRALAVRGVASELLDGDGVTTQEPGVSAAAVGGLLIPRQGFVGATALTRALAAGARKHGAQIIEHRRVRRIGDAALAGGSGGKAVVITDCGSLSCDAVVLAAGSWASQIVVEGAEAVVPVTPVRGQLLELQWNGPTLRRVIWGEHCYLVPWHDGTVLVGATVEDVGFDERTTVAGVHGLLAAACALVPATSASTFVSARAGLRPATQTICPSSAGRPPCPICSMPPGITETVCCWHR